MCVLGGGGGVYWILKHSIIKSDKFPQLKKKMFNIFTGPFMHRPVIYFQFGRISCDLSRQLGKQRLLSDYANQGRPIFLL